MADRREFQELLSRAKIGGPCAPGVTSARSGASSRFSDKFPDFNWIWHPKDMWSGLKTGFFRARADEVDRVTRDIYSYREQWRGHVCENARAAGQGRRAAVVLELVRQLRP